MATADDSLVNPVTGERVVFRRTAADTGGELLEFDNYWVRPGYRTAEHVHPGMEERWEVVSGRAGFRIGGVDRVAGPGRAGVGPAGPPHVRWKAAAGETHVRVEIRPALRWEEAIERLFAGIAAGRANDAGAPEAALVRELMRDFPDELAPP